jgi:hypothetical protein
MFRKNPSMPYALRTCVNACIINIVHVREEKWLSVRRGGAEASAWTYLFLLRRAAT